MLPRKTELTEHHKNCPHCLLILQYHFLQSSSPFLTEDCLDAKGWRTFPVFYPDDQKQIKKHVANCTRCRQLVSNRVRTNFIQDKDLFNKFAGKSKLTLKVQRVKRNIQSYVGNWVSGFRFESVPYGPFSNKHPWSVWNNEDRMLKLLGPKDLLSEEEQFYLAALRIGKDYNILDLDIVKTIEKIYFRKT